MSDNILKPGVDHYTRPEYLDPLRFLSLGHQVAECIQTQARTVLEIGKGSGLFQHAMSRMGVSLTTLDYDERLGPDIVSDVTRLALAPESFDAVCAFQVLEHLPFDRFAQSIEQMTQVAKEWVLVSLPDSRRPYRIEVDLGGLKLYQQRQFTFDSTTEARPQCAEHYWEIGYSGVRLRDVTRVFEQHDLRLKKRYRVFSFPYHHFFVLRKNDVR